MGVVDVKDNVGTPIRELQGKEMPWLYIKNLVHECALMCFRLK